MYKRITTNIIEEHFDEYHGDNGDTDLTYIPAQEDARMFTKQNRQTFKKSKLGNKKFGSVFSVVADEDTVLGAMIKRDHREYFTAYLLDLRSYIVARAAKSEEAAQIKDKLVVQARRFATTIQPYYVPEIRASIGTLFENFSNAIISYIDAVADGGTDVSDATVMSAISELAKKMNSISAFIWPIEGFTERLHTFFHEVAGQIWARMKSDWTEDQTQLDKSYITLVQGSNQEVSISDVLSKGLIALQPWRFRG